MNVDVQASGSLVVEMLDAGTGKALTGHTAQDCVPIMGNYVDVRPPANPKQRCRPASLDGLLTGLAVVTGGSAVARLRRNHIAVVGGAGGAECAAEVAPEGRRRYLLLRIRGRRRRMIQGLVLVACGVQKQ